jgi:hypothetical protein
MKHRITIYVYFRVVGSIMNIVNEENNKTDKITNYFTNIKSHILINVKK